MRGKNGEEEGLFWMSELSFLNSFGLIFLVWKFHRQKLLLTFICKESKLTIFLIEKVGAKTNFLFAKDDPASVSKEKLMVIEFA